MTKKLVVTVLAVLMIVLSGACAPSREPTTAPTPTAPTPTAPTPTAPTPTAELRIGQVTALTGPSALWGLQQARGAKYAIDDINEEGGIVVGGTRYKFKYFLEDGENNPEVATTSFNKLIFTDKCKIVLGPMGSAATLANAPLFEREKVLHLTHCYSPKATEPGKNLYTIRIMGQVTELMAPALVSKLKDLYPGVKTASLIVIDTETGESTRSVFEGPIQAADIQVIDTIYYPSGTPEHRPIVTKALAKNPDAIFFCGTPAPDAMVQLKEARLQGFKGPIWWQGTSPWDYVFQIVGIEAAEGFGCTTFDPSAEGTPPEIVALANRYNAEFEEKWDFPVASYYGAILMLKKAIELAESVDATQLRDQFLEEDVDWPSIWGAPVFMKDRLIRHPVVVGCVNGGKVVNFKAYPPGYPESAKK